MAQSQRNSVFAVFGALLFLLLLGGREAYARDLQGRVGVGYNSQFANSAVDSPVPGLSVKYALSRDLAVEAVVGMRTSSPTNTVSGVKLFKNLFIETNLNFYMALGGAVLAANGNSGVELIGTLGAEFFIPGLESLGFSFEAGGGLHNLTNDSFSFRTLGASFVDAGMHFYF